MVRIGVTKHGWLALGAVVATHVFAACAPNEEKLVQPDTQPPRVSIVSPAEDAWVADTVDVRVDVSDDRSVAHVTLLVDGETMGSRFQAPWTIPWHTGQLPDSTAHRLRVAAVDGAGNATLSEERHVHVCRNLPPRVRLLWPADEIWLDVGRTLAPWCCTAEDPDEDSLAATSIRGRLDDRVLDASGCVIPPPELPEGRHHVAVTATDRWGRTAECAVVITAFRYPEPTDPGGALECFLLALRAREPDVAGALLAPQFAQMAAGRLSHDARLPRDQVVASIHAIFADSSLSLFTLEGRLTHPEIFSHRAREHAKIEIRGLSLRIQRDAQRADRGGMERRVEYSGARIFLCPAEREGSWQILAWWDLHGAVWLSARGPSWTELLAEVRAR